MGGIGITAIILLKPDAVLMDYHVGYRFPPVMYVLEAIGYFYAIIFLGDIPGLRGSSFNFMVVKKTIIIEIGCFMAM